MTESLTKNTLQLFQKRPSTAVLMSGAGSNAITLLENKTVRDYYAISVIATDKSSSNARVIADTYDLEYIELESSEPLTANLREEYFQKLASLLGKKSIQVILYAGFMKISTEAFTKQFPGVNVHPADLTILGNDGLPKYRGMNAMNEMAHDFGYVRATVHIVDTPVDSGASIAISEEMIALPGEDQHDLHDRLKELEHVIYPEVLIRIAKGELDETTLPILITEAQGDGSW